MADTPIAWIPLIGPDEAEGRLRATYSRIAGPGEQVDRVLRLHGLRPHTLDAHLALYKATLHHAGNTLPGWFLELLGVYVSRLNGCAYCVTHHRAGLVRLVGETIASALLDAARDGDGRAAGDVARAHLASLDAEPRHAAALDPALAYARALTCAPAAMERAHVDSLRDAGLDDGEVLEVNQVVGYFAYVNRAVNGLEVSHVGERVGLAPTNAADEGAVSHR